MSPGPHGGEGRKFHAVSIRRIENGWLSSTTTGDDHGSRSVERFHAKKPVLGAGLRAGAAEKSSKPASRPRPARGAGEATYRDPAHRPKLKLGR